MSSALVMDMFPAGMLEDSSVTGSRAVAVSISVDWTSPRGSSKDLSWISATLMGSTGAMGSKAGTSVVISVSLLPEPVVTVFCSVDFGLGCVSPRAASLRPVGASLDFLASF